MNYKNVNNKKSKINNETSEMEKLIQQRESYQTDLSFLF
jgi:hypothetical protein